MRRYLEASRWAPNLTATAASAAPLSSPTSRAATGEALPRIRLLSGKGDVSSAGDALRAIDAMGVYRSEAAILLLDGCTVSNAILGTALASHVARKKADSDRDATFLTVVMLPRGGASDGSTCANGDALALALDAETGQIVRYECEGASATFGPPLPSVAAKKSGPPMSLRRDLVDTRVYIASQSALMHWSENYDYQHMRRDYIHNECQNAEFPFRFYAHVLGGGSAAYVAPICNTHAVHAVSMDVLARRVYPLVPDRDWTAAAAAAAAAAQSDANSVVHTGAKTVASAGTTVLQQQQPRQRWHAPSHVASAASSRANRLCLSLVSDGARVSALAHIGHAMPSLICKAAVLEADARVTGSIIGENCVIGAGARVHGSVLGRGVLLGADASVTDSVIGAGAILGAGVHVGRGCVLGNDVVVADCTRLPPFTRLTTVAVPPSQWSTTASSSSSTSSTSSSRITGSAGSDALVVGDGGVGRAWPAPGEVEVGGDDSDSDDDDEEVDAERAGHKALFGINSAEQAMASVSAALLEYRRAAASPAAAVATGEVSSSFSASAFSSGSSSPPSSASSSALAGALFHLQSSVTAALSVPLLRHSVGTSDLSAGCGVLRALGAHAVTRLVDQHEKASAAAAGVAAAAAAAAHASAPPSSASGLAPAALTPSNSSLGTSSSGGSSSSSTERALLGYPECVPSSSSGATEADRRVRFLGGVQEILLAAGTAGRRKTLPTAAGGPAVDERIEAARATGAYLTPETARSLAMEVKSFRFSDNRTSSDCIDGALPVALASIPMATPTWSASEYLGTMKTMLGAWKPFFEALVSQHGERQRESDREKVRELVSTVRDREREGFLLHAL